MKQGRKEGTIPGGQLHSNRQPNGLPGLKPETCGWHWEGTHKMLGTEGQGWGGFGRLKRLPHSPQRNPSSTHWRWVHPSLPHTQIRWGGIAQLARAISMQCPSERQPAGSPTQGRGRHGALQREQGESGGAPGRAVEMGGCQRSSGGCSWEGLLCRVSICNGRRHLQGGVPTGLSLSPSPSRCFHAPRVQARHPRCTRGTAGKRLSRPGWGTDLPVMPPLGAPSDCSLPAGVMEPSSAGYQYLLGGGRCCGGALYGAYSPKLPPTQPWG